MDDEQIRAIFARKRDLVHKLSDIILDEDWNGLSGSMLAAKVDSIAEELILEGWVDLKLPQKAIINQFNHPPGVRSADQV